MRAEELMLEDWVRITDDDTDEFYIVPVAAISSIGNIYASIEPDSPIYPFAEDCVDPIPLTLEILEKNGFEDISNHTLKGCNTFRLDIEQRGFDYCVTIKLKDYFKLQSYDDRWYTLCEMEFGCNYVHELQHALRLCGIDKEIIL